MNFDKAESEKKRSLRRVILLFVIAVGSLWLANSLFPVVRWLGPVGGQVVDAQTGAPVPDAAIAVSWLLQGWEGSAVRYLRLEEATTDENGTFRIPDSELTVAVGDLRNYQPEFRILAAGYLPIRASSTRGEPATAKHFALERAASPRELDSRLSSFVAEFHFLREGRHCEWRSVPKFVLMIERVRAVLAEQGLGAGVPAIKHLGGQDRCGNSEELFGEQGS